MALFWIRLAGWCQEGDEQMKRQTLRMRVARREHNASRHALMLGKGSGRGSSNYTNPRAAEQQH